MVVEINSSRRPETTLAMLKPDAVGAGKARDMMQRIELAGFTIVAHHEAHGADQTVDPVLFQVFSFSLRPFFPSLFFRPFRTPPGDAPPSHCMSTSWAPRCVAGAGGGGRQRHARGDGHGRGHFSHPFF